MTASREPGPPPSELGRRLALIIVVATFAVYPIGYVYARATHALVNYGSFISHPNAMSGWSLGLTWPQLVFAPCVWLEERVRGM